jgi:hypothetical protein
VQSDRTKSAYSGFLRALRHKSLTHSLLVKIAKEKEATSEDDPDQPKSAPIGQPDPGSEKELDHA